MESYPWRFLQRRTFVTGRVPTTGTLLTGELYLQLADETIYFFNSNGGLTSVLTDASGFGINKIKFSGANSGDIPIWNGSYFEPINLADSLTSGAGIDLSNYVTTGSTGEFVLKIETGNFITGVDLSNYVTTGETGSFLTGVVDLSSYLTTGETGSFLTQDSLSGYLLKSETGNFVTTDQTGNFLTGVDLLNYLTKSETGDFVTTGQTGIFALKSETGLFLTGVDLSAYVNSSETGIFVNTGETGIFVTNSETGLFLTGVDLSQYSLRSETGNFIVTGQTGSFVTKIETGQFLTGVDLSNYVLTGSTGNFITQNQTGNFVTTGETGNFAYTDGTHILPQFLPSYIDEIQEYSTTGFLSGSGDVGHIYLVSGCTSFWRWGGSTFFEITQSVASPGTSDSITEGTGNLFYKTCRVQQDSPVKSVAGLSGIVTCCDLLNVLSDCQGFVCKNETGNFITGVDLTLYITKNDTGNFVVKTETGNFVTTGQTGNFVSNTQTGDFLKASDLNEYVQTCETGNFLAKAETGNFISRSETGSFCVDLSPYATYLDLSNYASTSYMDFYVCKTETGNFVDSGSTGNFVTVNSTGEYLYSGSPYSQILPSGFCGFIEVIVCNLNYKLPYYIEVSGDNNGGGQTGTGGGGDQTGTGGGGDQTGTGDGGGGTVYQPLVITIDPNFEITNYSYTGLYYTGNTGINPMILPSGDLSGNPIYSGDDGILYLDLSGQLPLSPFPFESGGDIYWYIGPYPSIVNPSIPKVVRRDDWMIIVPIKCIAGIALTQGYAYYSKPQDSGIYEIESNLTGFIQNNTVYAAPTLLTEDLVTYNSFRLQTNDCSYSVGLNHRSQMYYELAGEASDLTGYCLYLSGGEHILNDRITGLICASNSCCFVIDDGILQGTGIKIYSDKYLENYSCDFTGYYDKFFFWKGYYECHRMAYTTDNLGRMYPSIRVDYSSVCCSTGGCFELISACLYYTLPIGESDYCQDGEFSCVKQCLAISYDGNFYSQEQISLPIKPACLITDYIGIKCDESYIRRLYKDEKTNLCYYESTDIINKQTYGEFSDVKCIGGTITACYYIYANTFYIGVNDSYNYGVYEDDSLTALANTILWRVNCYAGSQLVRYEIDCICNGIENCYICDLY